MSNKKGLISFFNFKFSAGIAKGTLYHHFKSVDDVVSAIMQKVIDDFMQSIPIEQFDSMTAYLGA